jgi:hypothetical protein
MSARPTPLRNVPIMFFIETQPNACCPPSLWQNLPKLLILQNLSSCGVRKPETRMHSACSCDLSTSPSFASCTASCGMNTPHATSARRFGLPSGETWLNLEANPSFRLGSIPLPCVGRSITCEVKNAGVSGFYHSSPATKAIVPINGALGRLKPSPTAIHAMTLSALNKPSDLNVRSSRCHPSIELYLRSEKSMGFRMMKSRSHSRSDAARLCRDCSTRAACWQKN